MHQESIWSFLTEANIILIVMAKPNTNITVNSKYTDY